MKPFVLMLLMVCGQPGYCDIADSGSAAVVYEPLDRGTRSLMIKPASIALSGPAAGAEKSRFDPSENSFSSIAGGDITKKIITSVYALITVATAAGASVFLFRRLREKPVTMGDERERTKR